MPERPRGTGGTALPSPALRRGTDRHRRGYGTGAAAATAKPDRLGAFPVAHRGGHRLNTEGKLHWFEVWAEDPGGEVGRGRHARAVVEAGRITAGAKRRAG